MIAKRSITFLLILSFTIPTFFLPAFAPRAHAFLGIADFGFTIDVKALARSIADGVAMILAKKLLDSMVQSTIDWAQNGFNGNPAYAVNPKQYFADIANGVAGDFIAGSDLSYLCSPFQTQIRLALQRQYTQPNQFQCTLTQVIGNINAFYNDFSQGGWDAWFVMTQNNANNPYGSFIDAQIELNSRVTKAVGIESQQLNWGSGFLSYKKCPDGYTFTGPAIPPNPNNPGPTQNLQPGDCLVDEVTVTPGETIKAGLDKVLPSPVDKLISVEHVEQLISAFFTGLLKRYVFGPIGLFDKSTYTPPTAPSIINTSAPGTIDIDGDGVIDGIDQDGDGSPDYCYFGGVGGVTNGPPCLPSSALPTQNSGVGGNNPAVCQNVTQQAVLNILTQFTPSNTGMTQALPQLQSAYGPQVFTFSTPGDPFVDKINFGGGMTVDVITDASGASPFWSWGVITPCPGSSGGGGGGGGSCVAPSTDPHPNGSGTVAQAKADLQAQGVNLSGACGAFAIVQEAAIRLGAGVFAKPSGNNCNGYAIDLIAYPDGYVYDVLVDAGGLNNPTWSNITCLPLDPSNYRTPSGGSAGTGGGSGTPPPAGRWKIGANGVCYFEPLEPGLPNQCTPP